MKSLNILFNVILVGVVAISGCGAGKPKGGEGISYFGAAWLNNERIVYTKQVDTVRFSYNPLAALGNNTSQLVRTDYFICTMDLEGKDEKELKQFVITDPVSGSNIRKIYLIDGDKKIYFDDEMIPWSYSCNDALIVFTTKHAPGGGFYGPIYTMKPNGSELKQIVEIGTNPRLSPDGKMILYTTWQDRIPQLWLINADGTEKMKLMDDAQNGVWSPDGERIAYECPSATKNPGGIYEDYETWRKNIIIYNLKTGEKKEFKRSNAPRDWSPDGKFILVEGGIDKIEIDKESVLNLPKLVAIPNYPRLSPDGEKIVGRNADLDADICIAYMYVTEREKAIKILKKSHFNKWND